MTKVWKASEIAAGLRVTFGGAVYTLVLVDYGKFDLLSATHWVLKLRYSPQEMADYFNSLLLVSSVTVTEEKATLTWAELTPEERKHVVEVELNRTVVDLAEGTVSLKDVRQQAKVDGAIYAANKMLTPWFAASYVYDAVAQDLREGHERLCRGFVYETKDGPYISQALCEKEATC